MEIGTTTKILLRALLACVALGIARVYVGPIDVPPGLIALCAPFLWAAVAPEHVVQLFGMLVAAARRAAHWRWQGAYYAYQGRHIRFYLVDEEI
jgi:hypothetical protein